MQDLILTLVFSVVMLVFMAFPAMKIVEWLETKMTLSDTWHNILQIVITILLSLLVGLFLRFA
ncbi:hypothetical protein [Sulfurovum riftiae]|uniref:Uncharacterized protein n=1 Tax=Sulfurovum riftiae TaxID=1630136 RepID=A0A151CGY6_9BACT|nr:hypothetical protein [Sulfurovum riftiae]KYJ86786.1 hypothetical protein AS592_08140 [Sulfurovum riftiae]